MRTLFILSFIAISYTASAWHQKISESDSLRIIEQCKVLLNAIEKNDSIVLDSISTDSIYCPVCVIVPDLLSSRPYAIHKDEFYGIYLQQIKNSEHYQKAAAGTKHIIVQENNSQTDYVIFWSTYQPNELGEGHEGAQFGIDFRKIDGIFMFSGMETIP